MASIKCRFCGHSYRCLEPTEATRCPACGRIITVLPPSKPTNQAAPGPATLPVATPPTDVNRQEPPVAEYTRMRQPWLFPVIAAVAVVIVGGAVIVALVVGVGSQPDGVVPNAPSEIAQGTEEPQAGSVLPIASASTSPTVAGPTPNGPVTTSAPNAVPKEMTPAELFAQKSPAVILIVGQNGRGGVVGLGSGFFISSDGVIVTNHHVAQMAPSLTVRCSNGRSLRVETIMASDPKADLAILKVAATDLPFIELTDRTPVIGTKVYAIGNPEGLTNSFSEGLISGLRDWGSRGRFLQTTAPISSGSSGGPLMTADGRVVGVTTATLGEGQNLNLAVPASRIFPLLRSHLAAPEAPPSIVGTRSDTTPAATTAPSMDRVWALAESGKYAEAMALLKTLKTTHEQDAGYWFAVGYIEGRLKHYQEAAVAYRQAASLDPKDPVCWFNLGINLDATNHPKDAIEAYRSVIRLDPQYTRASLRLAVDLQQIGQREEAISVLRKVIAAAPNSDEAANANRLLTDFESR